jgi:ketosteroid isomerase-like protein
MNPRVRPNALETIVQAEHAFAAWARDYNVRDAFIEHLSDSGIIFRPGPVLGRAFLLARPVRPGYLSWEPAYADVSSDGLLGYTTGPWWFRSSKTSDTLAATGTYFTVWRREAEGWKAMVDLGVSNEHGADGPSLEYAEPVNAVVHEGSAMREMMFADIALVANKSSCIADAYAAHLSNDSRILRDEIGTIAGPDAIKAYFSSHCDERPPPALKGETSRFGDMGYVYGSMESADGTSLVNSLRVWRLESSIWKLVADVRSISPK